MIIRLKPNKKDKKKVAKRQKTKSTYKNKNVTFDSFFNDKPPVNKVKTKKVKKPIKMSSGELLIANHLTSIGVYFEPEKEFKGCISPKTKCNLRYDFWLPNHNLLIEFDGIQHFKVGGLMKTKEDLEFQQLKDQIKNKFAKDNGMVLLRIKYTEKLKVGRIIDDALKSFFK